MKWNISPVQCIRELPAHLAELSNYLRDLTSRVRASIAEAIGDTVSRVIRDNLQRLWQQPPAIERPRAIAAESSYWRDDEDWNDDPWREEHDRSEPVLIPSSTLPQPSTSVGLAAMCLRGAGWWLQRSGSWLGALGIGLGVGALALIGGPIALAGLGLAEIAAELIALNGFLSKSATTLAV